MSAEDDSSALISLGGFALSEVLAELGIDTGQEEGALDQLGLANSRRSAISKDSIYNESFVDDQGEADDVEKDDLEAQVDREIYQEQFGSGLASTSAGVSAPKGGAPLLRGEEDDFDDDDDEEAPPTAAPSLIAPLAPPPLFPFEAPYQPIKLEQEDLDLFGASPTPPPPPPPRPAREKDVRSLYPDFDKGKVLDFTELFAGTGRNVGGRKRKRAKVDDRSLKVELPEALSIAKSSRDTLMAPLRPSTSAKGNSVQPSSVVLPDETTRRVLGVAVDEEMEMDAGEESLEASLVRRGFKAPSNEEVGFSNTELDDWEDRIVWDPVPSNNPYFPNLLAHRNALFASGDWTKSIIWSPHAPYKPYSTLSLNLNDPEMYLEFSDPAALTSSTEEKRPKTTNAPAGSDFLNLSNDKEYEVAREAKKKIRQTFGLLEVQHAWPAAKLQLPFYKTRLTKSDARSFHRPAMQFPQNVQLSFSKVRSKKKKDKMGRKIRKGDIDAFKSMGDLSLRDTAPFLLWEYSEENPPIISNVGMGTTLVNYYRKKDAEDDFVPQLDIGEPFLLDSTDESPFKAFGMVEPGQTVQTLYNNLIRAPVFRHKPHETDFLLVRTTVNGEVTYYIREIKTMFVVGQTYPMIEVPGPHSRKISTLVKNRLQTIAVKLVKHHPKERIKVNKLTRYFPDQSDLQMRQRLKEFMEFNRKGDNQGFWSLKPTFPVPDEEQMLKNATPEMVCLAEAMQVGLRHLQDAGYGQAEEGGAGDDDSKLDIEQQLAPWITTKNFLNANANKAMLKLHGEGDPTGRGEAFSFLRVSMKDIFLRAGESMESRLAHMKLQPKSAHKYNVQEQQEIYKEEIARIWKAQQTSLSDPVEPLYTQDDEDRSKGRHRRGGSMIAETPLSFAGTPRDLWASQNVGTPGSRASTPDREDGMSVASGRAGSHKILRVKRLINDVWSTEVVRDPAIIKAYLKQRQTIDEERTDADDLLPSDDEGKNERRKKRLKEQLEKLKRNQERRLARKNQKLGIAPGAIGVGGKKAAKPETTRICGNCGQRGHMKTSKRLCPRWHEFNAPKEASQSNALPTAFGTGLGLPSAGLPYVAPAGSASSPPAPKPGLKLKFGGAMSPK